MKVLLALALFLWAAAAHHTPEHNLRNPIFLTSQTQRYELTLNLTSGIPGLTSQLAKAVIKAHVNIRPKSNTEYLLKIEDVKVSEPTPSVGSDEEYMPLRRSSQLESDLSKPIKFTLRDGEIESYTLDKSEGPVSKKIKRSILRHLEIKLQDKEERQYPNSIEEYPYSYNYTKERNYGPVTSVVSVNVKPYPEFPYEKNVFNISKTEIYEPLGYPVNHTHHNFAKQGCPEVCRLENCNITNKWGAGCPVGYEPHHTPLKMYVTSHLNLRMLRNRMILENMVVQEKHIASTYDQDMVVTITAEYNLEEVSDKHIEEPREPTQYRDLEYEIETSEEEDTNTEFPPETYFLSLLFPKTRSSEIVSVIERELERLVQTVIKAELERKETQIVGEQIIVIHRALTLLRKNELETVWRKIVNVNNYRNAPEEEKVKRQILLDILPLVGTEECVEFIRKLIEDQKVTIYEAREILESLPENLITPNERNIKNLYALLELSHIKRQPLLHSAAYITLARVIRATCVQPMFHNVTDIDEATITLRKPYMHLQEENARESSEERPYSGFLKAFKSQRRSTLMPECPKRFVLKFIEETAHKLWNARQMQEKVIYIETLAHISSPRVLPVLLPYVYGTAKDIQQYSPADVDFLKTVTLYALHNLVGYFPVEMIKYMAPVYFNLTEVPRVRIAAFTIVLKSQPPLSLLEHIALESWNEVSNEVGSFVYSAIQTYGNASEPCMKLTAKRIQMVISQFKSYDIGYQYAQSIITTFFDKLRNFGFQAKNTYVPSNETFVPHGVYTSWMYNINNLKDVLLELALNVQGVYGEEILKYLDAEVMGLRWPKNIPENKENEIFETLNLLPRLPKEFRMTIYRKIFYTSTYTFVDAETIKSTFQPLYEHIKNVFYGRNEFRGHFIKVYIPSSYHTFGIGKTIAFPVQFHMKHPLLLSLKVQQNTIQKEKSPAMKFWIRPTVFYTAYHTKQVFNPVDQKAYGVYFEQKVVYSLPLEVYLHFNKENNTVVLTTKLPELPKRVFWYHSEAGTYAGTPKLERLASTENREPITTIPTLFEKQKVLQVPTLPLVKLLVHSEDITEGIEDIPRSWYEVMELGVKYLRNPGWRRKSVNVTVEKNPRNPVDMITFTFSYNRTEKYEKELQHAPMNDWSSVEEMQSSHEMEEELQSLKREDLGLPKSAAKKIYESFVHQKRHIAHEFEVLIQTNPAPNMVLFRTEYNHTYDRTRHAFFAYAKTQLAERRTPYEVCLAHVMQYVNIPNEFEYSYKKYGDQRADFYNSINFKECNVFRTSDIVTHGSFVHVPSEELFDKDEFAHTLRKEWFLPETHEECLQDMKDGKSLSVPCMRAIREESIFNRYQIRTEWKNEIPEIVRNITYKINDAVKYAFYGQSDINRINVKNQEKTVDVTVDYIDKLTDVPVLNVYMETPRETIHYHKINAENVKPLSGLYRWHELAMNEVSNNTYPSTCVLMEKQVQTYDLMTYELPQDQCTYLLSTHCAEKKTFAVLAKHLTTTHKEITVYVENHKIVLKPTGRRGNYVVQYDGKDFNVAKNMPIVLEREAGLHAFVIPVKHSQPEEILVFHAKYAGVKIHFDGKIVKLQVNPLYKGRLCGLCSEFDGETTQEYRGVDQCVYSDSLDFARSCIVDSKKCGVNTRPKFPVLCQYGQDHLPQDHSRSQQDSEEEESQQDDDEPTRPISRTIHIQREDKVCFSIEPMPMCKEDYSPEETERKAVSFHCLPKYDATTRKLVIESRKRILRELANKSVDFTETLSVPKTCSH